MGNDVAHYDKKYLFRGHYGGIGACESVCLYNRALGIGFTIASNGNNDNVEIEELITSFLEQNLPVNTIVTQPLDKINIKPFLGFYQSHSPRLEIGALRDWFLGGTRIYIKNDTLRSKSIFDVKSLSGIQTAPWIFMGNANNTPSLVFTKTTDGKMVFAGAFDYFEKESFLLGIFKRLVIIGMIAIVLLSGIMAILTLVNVCIGKGFLAALPIKFLPITAFGFLLLAVFKLLEVDTYTYLLYELTYINSRTLLIYFSTLFFSITALICFGATMYTLSTKNKKRLSEWFWIATYLSVCISAIILFKAGFIGLKTWAM